MPRRPYLGAAAIGAAIVTSGCGFGAVELDPHSLTPGSESACNALDADLPDVVSDAVRRDVQDEPAGIVAWGEPPVVLRCGVGLPPEYQPDAVLTELNGVAWLPVEGVGGDFFATVDRDPIVEMAIPDAYEPTVVLGDVGPAILEHIPERELR
ncbi:MAG TPA: DUF3515 domain-containing protein [Jiangellaceae bacterium]